MNILLSTDGMPHSENAVNFAFDYSRLKGEPLYAVFVAGPVEEERERAEELGRSILAKLEERGSKEGVKVKGMIEAGSPYETILDVADKIRADVIVVGTSGKTVIDRVLIGSVSEYVVRNAKCTVVVVR